MALAFLYSKDIEIVNGVCDKTARQYIKDINIHFDLPARNFVSLKSYCDYFRADERHVLAMIESGYRGGKSP